MRTYFVGLFLITSFGVATVSAVEVGNMPAHHHQQQEHRQHAIERWKAADADKDGAINKQEAATANMNHLTKNFDDLDTNKDGKVTQEEMRAAKAKHPHSMQKPHDSKSTH